MKRKDDFLLENLYQEGIFDRVRGQGAGLVRGAGAALQKAGAKIAGKETPNISARSEYAKAQQKSLLNSFKNKVQKEINDFYNDLREFKVDPDLNEVEKNFPIIAQRIKEVENLSNYLSDPEKYPKPSTISPDFEVLPPEDSSEKQQPTEPETGNIPSLPPNNRMGLPAPEGNEASKANADFLAARGTQATEETPKQEPEQTTTTTTKPKGKADTQVILDDDLNTTYQLYGNVWYARTGSDKQGTAKYEQVADKNLINRLKEENKSQLKSLSSKSKAPVPTKKTVTKKTVTKKPNSLKTAQKIAGSGKKTMAQINAERMQESSNAFAEFLKGYQLV
jgi:hypothetical protein